MVRAQRGQPPVNRSATLAFFPLLFPLFLLFLLFPYLFFLSSCSHVVISLGLTATLSLSLSFSFSLSSSPLFHPLYFAFSRARPLSLSLSRRRKDSVASRLSSRRRTTGGTVSSNRPRRWYTIHKLCRQVYERSEVVLAVASCIVPLAAPSVRDDACRRRAGAAVGNPHELVDSERQRQPYDHNPRKPDAVIRRVARAAPGSTRRRTVTLTSVWTISHAFI